MEDLDKKEQLLKITELELKITELKKPDYKKVGFWISSITILLAISGTLTQGVLSNIRKERAELDLKQTRILKDSAVKEMEIASQKKLHSEEELIMVQKKKDSLSKDLEAMQNQLISITSAVSKTKDSSLIKKVNNLNNFIEEAKTKISKVSIRLDIFYIQNGNTDNNKNKAEDLAKQLNGKADEIRVRMLSKEDNLRSGYGINKNELRYDIGEETIAEDLQRELNSISPGTFNKKLTTNITPNYLSIFIAN